MAGAFTHMAIIAEAVKSFPVGHDFGDLLHSNKNFLTLGGVSPDIPYLSQLAFRGATWADIMHYHKTNGIVSNGLHSLAVAKRRNKIWQCQLSWLLGFVGHLVSDATIHPVVESIVGPYTNKDTNLNHRVCEMVQDVMILKEVMNLDVTAAEYTDYLRACQTHSAFDKVTYFWDVHAKANCPFAGELDSKAIIQSYVDLIDTAEGGNAFARAFRHFGKDFLYQTYEDLTQNSADLVNKYYLNISLPNGLSGTFYDEGYKFAVKNLITIWSKIERSLYSNENISRIVPNWNLDTGIDQDNEIRTYWS